MDKGLGGLSELEILHTAGSHPAPSILYLPHGGCGPYKECIMGLTR